MLMVGYDDAMGGFLAVNSWGSDWGLNGYLYLSYDFVRSNVWEAWVMTDHVETQSVKRVEGRVVVNGAPAAPGTPVSAVVDGQVLNAVARKLHGFIQSAVDADFADDMQDNVFARNPLGGFSVKHKRHGGRNAQPGFAVCHADGHIRRADAGRKRAERTVGAGVAVRADDQIAGCYHTFFGQKAMLDADLADIKEVHDVFFIGELPDFFGLFRGLDIFVRCEMVQHQGDFFSVKDAVTARLSVFVDGDGGRDVVGQNHVQVGHNHVAGRHGLPAAVGGEDFLRSGHAHGRSPLSY